MKQNIKMKIYLRVLLRWVWNKNLNKVRTWISTKFQKICYLAVISLEMTITKDHTIVSRQHPRPLFSQTFCLSTHLCSETSLNWCKGKRMAQVDVNDQDYSDRFWKDDCAAVSGLYKLRKTRLDLNSNEPNFNATKPTERKMAVMRCNTKIFSFSFLLVYFHRYRPGESTPMQLLRFTNL